ncbi:MAG: hypothetical protein ABFD54_00125 [Armatimonadota bacterium]|nr:hypothetical protein [bacterium]
MRREENPLKTLIYIIVGLLVLMIAVWVVGLLLSLIGRVVTFVISVALAAVILYVAYLVGKVAIGRMK